MIAAREFGDPLTNTGLSPAAIRRFIAEEIDTLPGVRDHAGALAVLLTGSRAVGTHGAGSDVDIDVVCAQGVYHSVVRASYAAGLISTDRGFFRVVDGEGWERYFGAEVGRPHFSLTPLERVAGQFAAFEDVPLWIWTHARILRDPGGRFAAVRDGFAGYPRDVLVRKLKYHWLCAGYAGVDVYPHHHAEGDHLAALTAVTAMANALLRLFFLLDGGPFPYTERLVRHAGATTLGRRSLPQVQRALALAVGAECPTLPAWDRLDDAIGLLLSGGPDTPGYALEQACLDALIAAGVEPAWVAADYDNVDELLTGQLGPVP